MKISSCLLMILLGTYPALCMALPPIDKVVHGQVEVSLQGNEMQIRAIDATVLNYKNFNIQGHETVRFHMSKATDCVLIRVESDFPSQIQGKLFSNGVVYLLNPAGILFGPNSVENVSQLYAAAAHLGDQDFLSRTDRFNDVKGIIEIYGKLQAKEITVIARSLLQKGEVKAEAGQVIFATAENVSLGKEEGHLHLKSDREAFMQLEDEEPSCFLECGSSESFLLYHSGKTSAKKIQLYGGKDSLIQVGGVIDVSSTAPEAHGGRVEILGEVIALEGAKIDGSGSLGGGEIFIGGGTHGKGLYPTAKYTSCDDKSEVRVDALDYGNGGRIILWSERATSFDAKLFSRGAEAGGDGGYIETSSGNQFRGVLGRIDASAPRGKIGQWDLGPYGGP